jgi:hypothetical protein
MDSINSVLQARLQQSAIARQAVLTRATSSIEGNVSINITSIELTAKTHRHAIDAECYECLPKQIDDLIEGKSYRRKYRAMIKQGYLKALLQLVDMVREVEAAGKIRKDPRNMFAKYARKENWERTLKHLVKQAKIRQAVARAASKLGNQINEKVIYKFAWAGSNIERWADLTIETPHAGSGQSKARYFSWLCQQELAAR